MVTGLPSMPRTSVGIGLVLLVLVRQVVAVHVEELGAHEAEALRAVGERLLELARQFEIGLERDLDAVARHRRQRAAAARAGAARLRAARRAASS